MKNSLTLQPLLIAGIMAIGIGPMAADGLASKAVEPELTIINQDAFKGQKPFTLENYKDKVIVLEFWASWCPPCRESIPVLSKEQEKYKGKAVFVGVSMEPEKETTEFYDSMKDNMRYRVAIDPKGVASKNYMDAFEVSDIPTAFIVKDGKVIWYGDPRDPEMEKALEKAVAAGDGKTKK